ncbi:monooxygenase (plasmid) [Pararhizobium polonicum]|uniref:Monooxygenase n=1 Tax=Pararhizobium polonicum TaxID=1612624 RepID=A0A1C7P923_9HYPH|nr:FAD-dependent monooxygenase [Pararhizobium polonicum]OBZ97556.1 monooxygenase [Pararhizobium polonicum]
MKPKLIDIVGAGPAGLYTAILARRLLQGARVRVTEQNPQGATFGFGVVFSYEALDFLRADDPELHALITPQMERWQNMTLNIPGRPLTIDGVGFTAIGRLRLIEILRERAATLGVELRFDTRIDSADLLDGDLIVGADGINSVVRQSDQGFQPSLEHFGNCFAWFGTPRRFETLTQSFVQTRHGALNAHHYRYAPDISTFIVECTKDTFELSKFASMSEAESACVCAGIFSEVLEGAPLITNRSVWRQFPRLWCERWVSGNRVILGDAAHTAHFSVGSGTRLAFDDAIALMRCLSEHDDMYAGLAAYQEMRPPIAAKIVNAANTSALWYESFDDRLKSEPIDFAFSYITRSGRVDRDRLRKIAPEFAKLYDAERPATVPVL